MSGITVSTTSTVIVTAGSATAADWIEATRRYLYTGAREPRNRLATAIDGNDTTLTLQYAAGAAQQGALLSVGLEEMYVWGASGQTLTVDRGQYGTSAEAHSSGAVITVNPRFSDFAIFKALNDELRELSSPSAGLYRVLTVDLTWNAVRRGYDLTGVSSVDRILEVRYQTIGPTEDWPVVSDFHLGRNLDTTEFSSGNALFLDEPIVPGQPVRVSYAAPFGLLSGLNDNILTTTGIPVTAYDIPPVGAAIRLTAGREIRRNFDETQGDTRRAEEVPPNANLNAAGGLRALRAERIRSEAQRLNARYPIRHPRRRYVY